MMTSYQQAYKHPSSHSAYHYGAAYGAAHFAGVNYYPWSHHAKAHARSLSTPGHGGRATHGGHGRHGGHGGHSPRGRTPSPTRSPHDPYTRQNGILPGHYGYYGPPLGRSPRRRTPSPSRAPGGKFWTGEFDEEEGKYSMGGPMKSKNSPRRRLQMHPGRIGMKDKGPGIRIDMSEMVLKKFRECLSHRYGPNCINKLQNLFIIARGSRESDGNLKNLTLEDMHHVLDIFGCRMTDDSLQLLMQAIDPNNDGVSEDELIEAVRGPVSQSRQKIIGLVFDKLDASKTGIITHEDMATYYNVDWDPDVRTNNVPAGVPAIDNFFNQFDNDHDGLITRSEFVKHYANMSHSFENDDAFELMLINAWHLTGIMKDKTGNEMNTSNLRAEVVFVDGSQKVVTVDNDIGIRQGGHVNTAILKKRLEKQGLKNIQSASLGYAN